MWIFNPLKGKFETTDSKVKPLCKVSIPNWLGLISGNILFRGDKTGLNLYAGNPLWKKRIIEDLIKGLRFSYRRKITVTEQSGNDLTDYQVLIELNSTNFDFNHSDGNDIRFYDGEVFLPYWVEKWDSVNQEAKIWVKVSSIPANGSTSFYMYYGNPVLLSASSPELTFIRVIDGCVLALPMDEGSGDTVYDKSGNDNDGTIYGATWTDGKFGKALSFDGEDDYVDIGITNIDDLGITNKLTVNVWVYPEEYKIQDIVSKDYTCFSCRLLDDQKIGLEVTTENGYKGLFLLSYSLNEWIFIAYRYNGEKMTIFKNGEKLSPEYSWSGDLSDNTKPLTIGARPSYVRHFKGIIDEVHIYNRALSEEEIQDLYNYYGYNTENYPGKTLVRKRVEPEPSVSIENEEIA